MSIFSHILTALGWAFAAFCLWMLLDCIKNEEDQDERTSFAMFIVLLAPIYAPVYFFQRYLPRKRQKKNDKDAA